jgi:hypothetical protein
MKKLAGIYLPVLKASQRMGLVVPCLVKGWDHWWQEATCHARPSLSVIRMSRQLLHPLKRRRVLSNYSEEEGETTPGGLFAHEMGHAFRQYWIRNRTVAPLAGWRRHFGSRSRFDDPWNDLQEFRAEHGDLNLDTDRFLSWYAWADPEEDFCDCFAELILSKGDIAPYRGRPGVYGKLVFIQRAGKTILRHHPILRACNLKGQILLSVGEISFACPAGGHTYGVPDVRGRYVCPCGASVEHDGCWVRHD